MTAPSSLQDLYREHARSVTRWAARLLGRPEEAPDVAQEVFLVAQRRLSTVGGREGAIEGWLFRITENVVRARRRRDRLRAWLLSRHAPTAEELTPGPDATLEQKQDIRLVHRVLEDLGERDRALVVLFELEGYSGAQVAQMLALSPQVIWVRLHRARARFLARLQELSAEDGP